MFLLFNVIIWSLIISYFPFCCCSDIHFSSFDSSDIFNFGILYLFAYNFLLIDVIYFLYNFVFPCLFIKIHFDFFYYLFSIFVFLYYYLSIFVFGKYSMTNFRNNLPIFFVLHLYCVVSVKTCYISFNFVFPVFKVIVNLDLNPLFLCFFTFILFIEYWLIRWTFL